MKNENEKRIRKQKLTYHRGEFQGLNPGVKFFSYEECDT